MSDTTAPQRIQRRRVTGWRMPPGTVYVGRGTKWGNPFKVVENTGDHPDHGRWLIVDDNGVDYPTLANTRMEALAHAVHLYQRDIAWGSAAITVAEIRRDLCGRDLACWCPLPEPGEPDICHASALLAIARGGAP